MGDMLGIGSMVSSGVTAGANIAATEMTNKTNREIADSVNKTNLDLAQKQNDFNYKMWQENNAYNSPKAQFERLTGAGLSKAAAAQAASGFEASPVQSADLSNQQIGAPMQSPDLSALSGLNVIGVARQLAQLRKDKADAKIAETESEFKEPMLLTDYDLNRYELMLRNQQFQQNAEMFPYRLDSLRVQNANTKAVTEDVKAARRLKNMQFKLAKQEFGWLEKLNREQLNKLTAEIKEIGSRISVNSATKQNIEAQTETEKERKEGISLDNAIKDVERILKEYGSPDSQTERVGVMLAEGKLDYNSLCSSFYGIQQYLDNGGRYFAGDGQDKVVFYKLIHDGMATEESLGLEKQVFNSVFNKYGYSKRYGKRQ